MTTSLYFLSLVWASAGLSSGNMNQPTYDRWIIAMDRTRDYRWPR